MKGRLTRWAGETHGAGIELFRHFASGLLRSDDATERGQWLKVGVGTVSSLIPLALLFLPVFWQRYGCLEIGRAVPGCPAVADYRATYLALVRADQAGLIGLAMWLTALVTALLWHRLMPERQDQLALASLPVSSRQVLAAKAGAMLAALTVFLVVANALPSGLLAAVIAGRWQENPSYLANAAATLLATTSSAAFAFFGLLALQGILLNTLPFRVFDRVSSYLQGAVVAGCMAALPFLWPGPASQPTPPVKWFLGLWAAAIGARDGSGLAAALALGAAAAIATISYAAGYGRYQRSLAEGRPSSTPGHAPGWLHVRGFEWLVRDPREQAVLAFLWKTLVRSRAHRLALLAYGGCGIGWLGQGILENQAAPHNQSTVLEYALRFGPLPLAFVAVSALRLLFSIPSQPGANWILRLAEGEGRESWLRGVERFSISLGVAPVFLFATPGMVALWGWGRAARLSVLGILTALTIFELVFRNWRKMPFTCTYLFGKRPLWQLAVMAVPVLSALGLASAWVFQASNRTSWFLAVVPLHAGLWWKLRTRRRATMCRPLVYEEQPEAAVDEFVLELNPAVRVVDGARSDSTEGGLGAIFGKAEHGADRAHRVRGLLQPGSLWEDVRGSVRAIAKDARLSLAVTLILSLGIGVFITAGTLINALVFRARVENPATFVRIAAYPRGSAFGRSTVTEAGYSAYRAQARSLSSLAAMEQSSVTIDRDYSSEVRALLVSCDFFEVYGLRRPVLGRLFSNSECGSPANASVAILAEEAWRSRFGADPKIAGKTVLIDDSPFTVIGVVPARHPSQVNGASVWLPLSSRKAAVVPRGGSEESLVVEGRLAPGYSRRAVQAELAVITDHLDAQHPGRRTVLVVNDGSWIANAVSMGANVGLVYLFMGGIAVALGMLLMVACANATILMLARAIRRRREMAIRLALGAPPLRLLRRLLIETLLLTALAGGIALSIARVAPNAIYSLLAQAPPFVPLAPDWRISLLALAVVLIAGCVAGLLPASEALRVDLASTFKSDAAAMPGAGGRFRLRNILVAVPVALSLVLLSGAMVNARLCLRSYRNGAGPDARHVLVIPLHFPRSMPSDTVRQMRDRITARLEEMPGLRAMSYSRQVPLTGSQQLMLRRPGEEVEQPADIVFASPSYFTTLGIPILRGRDFRDSDSGASVSLVSASLARKALPGEDPIGKHLRSSSGETYEVIGVAGDSPSVAGRAPTAYLFTQDNPYRTNLLLRVALSPAEASRTIQSVVSAAVPGVSVRPRVLQEWIDERSGELMRVTAVVLALALVTAALAVAGLYGLMSFAARQRTREFGIRAALGAGRADIIRAVLASGAKPVAMGLILGLWLSIAAGSALKALPSSLPLGFETESTAACLAAALMLGLTALAGMLLPAWRAAQMDPQTAIRHEGA